MVERVAKAIYGSAVSQGRALLSRQVFPTSDIKSVFHRAAEASDREAAIITFCLVDDIASAFSVRSSQDVSRMAHKKHFFGSGILASAHGKLTFLSGLRWIREYLIQTASFYAKDTQRICSSCQIQLIQ
jgi:hypothetical protein